MVAASMVLFLVHYVSDGLSNDVTQFMWVDAADDESADKSYDITIDMVEDKMAF